MTRPVKVDGPKTTAYITKAYAQLQKVVAARAAVQAAAGQAAGEAPPVVFSGGSSALGATAGPIIAALDSTAATLQAAINAAGAHKDEQEKKAREAREEFCEVPSDDIEKPLNGGGKGADAGGGEQGATTPWGSGARPGGIDPWGSTGSPWSGGSGTPESTTPSAPEAPSGSRPGGVDPWGGSGSPWSGGGSPTPSAPEAPSAPAPSAPEAPTVPETVTPTVPQPPITVQPGETLPDGSMRI